MPDNQEEVTALHREAVEFFRAEIDRRYARDYLRSALDLPEEDLLRYMDEFGFHRIQQFFKRVLYPSGEERDKRDRAVQAVTGLLSDRRRLRKLLPHAPKLLLKHGSALGTASRAALDVLSAFHTANRVENELIRHLQERCNDMGANREEPHELPLSLYRAAFGDVSRRSKTDLIRKLRSLTRLATRVHVVEATRDVLHELQRSIADDHEQWAITYALSVLDEVERLASSYSRDQIRRLVELIEQVEYHYLEDVESYR